MGGYYAIVAKDCIFLQETPQLAEEGFDRMLGSGRIFCAFYTVPLWIIHRHFYGIHVLGSLLVSGIVGIERDLQKIIM